MKETRLILGLSAAGVFLMALGVMVGVALASGWAGAILLVVGLVTLGIGWYRFVKGQRKALWSLHTETRNLRERQLQLAGSLDDVREEISTVRRDQNRLSEEVDHLVAAERPALDDAYQYALDLVRQENRRHELKLRELERVLLGVSGADRDAQ